MSRNGPQRHRVSIYRPRGRWAGTSLGALLTVLLHALLLGTLLMGNTKLRVRVPDQSGAGASVIQSHDEPVMTLILFNDSVVRPEMEGPPLDLASVGVQPNDLLVTIASPDIRPAQPLEELDDAVKERSTTPDAQGDQAQRALLFGRYMGQVTARVERAWSRPRTPVETGHDVEFSCQVQVTQDEHGQVLAVIVRSCNGDERWKQSLVQAIRSAAPLPAPATPAVFADSLTLSFHTAAYVNSGSEEGFEPERLAVVSSN